MLPLPLSDSADGALRALARASGAAPITALRGPDLLTERARLLGLTFRARRSPAGFCRLLDTRDGIIAVNLPRDNDWELLPAWLEAEPAQVASWAALGETLGTRSAAALQERARLLGLPAALATPATRTPPPYLQIRGPALPETIPPTSPARRAPRVVDLSALWAGPLCAHLLYLCGADVIKVESLDRPDGARQGDAAFYALLNQGKRCVAVNLARPDGRSVLLALIRCADIVIESARPRALEQLGIDAAELLRECPALTWVSITGYGRDGPQGQWVAFGDDAGVAAGLSHAMAHATGDAQILGDAIADPLTGIRAALAAWRSWQQGGGRLIALALADVAAASVAETVTQLGPDAWRRALATWWEQVRGRQLDPTGVRTATAPAHELGADTDAVLAELTSRC